MAKLSDKVKGLRGNTPQQVLEEMLEESHTMKQVVVMGVKLDGSVVMMRTRMDIGDLSLCTKILDFHCIDLINRVEDDDPKPQPGERE